MKRIIKLFCLTWMILLTTMGCATEQPWWEATPARRARADGALVTLQVHVVDETGAPVEDAYVGVGFWAPRGPERDNGETDENGYIELEARCRTDGTLVAKKEGYYPSRLHVDYIATDDETIEETIFSRRWKEPQPVTIELRKVHNPTPLIAWGGIFLSLPRTDKTLALDLELMDWLPPYGEGKVKDVFITPKRIVTQRGQTKLCKTESLILTFPNAGDGVWVRNVTQASLLKSQYQCDTNGMFEPMLELHRSKEMGPIFLSEKKYLFFRVRSVFSSEGRLLKAHYGKIYGTISIELGDLLITGSYFNPVPNETNLEFDPKRNLAPDETLEQRQRRRVYLP